MESSNISNICMNQACKATTSSGEWQKGWVLKSSGLATLCTNCGSAYENSILCETFHREESGWRECKFCGKDYLDFGGVGCLSCIKFSETQLIRQIQESTWRGMKEDGGTVLGAIDMPAQRRLHQIGITYGVAPLV